MLELKEGDRIELTKGETYKVTATIKQIFSINHTWRALVFRDDYRTYDVWVWNEHQDNRTVRKL